MVVLIVAFYVLMAIIDGVYTEDYFVKFVINIVLFLMLPTVYSFFDKDIKIKEINLFG